MQLAAKIKSDLDVDVGDRDFLPFPDLHQSVKDDVHAIKESPIVAKGVVGPGWVCMPSSCAGHHHLQDIIHVQDIMSMMSAGLVHLACPVLQLSRQVPVYRQCQWRGEVPAYSIQNQFKHLLPIIPPTAHEVQSRRVH